MARMSAKIKVLLAEDNDVNQLVASTMLKAMSCEVDVAINGFEAIKRAKLGDYNIIFMDCQMPDVDGYEATAEIKKLVNAGSINPVPIVALTAHALDADREKCLSVGMDDYICKPVSEADLKRMLEVWVTHKVSEEIERKIDNKSVHKLKDLMGAAFPQLVEMYIKNTEDAISRMNAAIASSNFSEIQACAHTMRSPSAQLGLAYLSKIASNIELRAKEGALEDLKGLILDLDANFRYVLDDLKKL